MQELKKILEEIDEYIRLYSDPPIWIEAEGTVKLLRKCKNIIRKHMNDGWIPVKERLPSEEEFKKAYCQNKYAAEFIVMIEGATLPTTLYFRNGIWADEENNHYKVIAWQLLPEPYRPEKEEK